MTTAPSDTRKATGMLPWAGGVKGFGRACGCLPFAAAPEPGAAAARAPARSLPAAENGMAARTPNAAAPCSNSLLFMVDVLSIGDSRLLVFVILAGLIAQRLRSASDGCTAVARRAGSRQARAATATSTRATAR